MTLALRPYRPDDLPALRALYGAQVAPAPGWTEAEAPVHWRWGREVAERDGRVVGGVGQVSVPPWFYVFPLVAEDAAVAVALLEVALPHACTPGHERIRVGVRTGEDGKRAALIARGFTRSIDLIDLIRPTTGAAARPAAPADPDLVRVAPDRLDRAALKALHDLTFAEVPNAGPIPDDELAALLDGEDAWPEATGVWADAGGTYRGFVLGQRAADARGRFGRVDAIGVDPALRGRGLARVMLDQLLDQAEREALAEVRTLIASTNAASLALHARAGFTPCARREMWDLPVAALSSG